MVFDGTTTYNCILTYSDERLKTDVQNYPDASGLAAIAKLRPITFHWKDSQQDKQEGAQIGFVAQEMEKVFPQVVKTQTGVSKTIQTAHGAESIKNPKMIDYREMVVPLVKAVQELKAMFDGDHSAIEALKVTNDNLQKQIDELKAARR